MRISHATIDSYRVVIAGLLVVFALRIVVELSLTPVIGFAIAAISFGIILSKITATHFGHIHAHAGDSVIDTIPIVVLLFANIMHPAIDGFTTIETFQIGGVVAGALFAGSVIFHEVLRQSAFVAALQPLHIRWQWVVATASIGILIGIGAALAGAQFFGRYEIAADLATLFSYSFVISEFYFLGRQGNHSIKNTKGLFILGGIVGAMIAFLMQG